MKINNKNWQEKDRSGQIAEEVLKENFPNIELKKNVVPDESKIIQNRIEVWIQQDISFILTLGGTGISNRDITIEAIKPLYDKELLGFGELFRQKTFETVGTISIMTRATAGVTKNTCITCLPGSPNATRLGLELILAELEHIIALRRK
jgi:molybdenum cofactor biosynthesis protein B